MYDQLSKDPNSLANLDQDLPNYVQHTIPIFSLPKEWLWCESWCGDSTKKKVRDSLIRVCVFGRKVLFYHFSCRLYLLIYIFAKQ